jgi:dipeptidyl aminopeptidase/acylaminoacyl peptidase
MYRLFLPLYVALAAGLFSVSTTKAQQPPKIPIESFAALPNLAGAELSFDGKSIAYLIPEGGRQQLRVQNLADNTAITVPPLRDTEISTFYWANNDIILVKLTTETRRFRGTKVTQESTILSFNTKTHEAKWLGRPYKPKLGERASQRGTIRDFLPNEPDFILLELNLFPNLMFELYRTNIRTGGRTLVQGERTGIQNWYTDSSHHVRLGTGYTRQSKWRARFKNKDGDWVDIDDLGWSDHYSIRGFSPQDGIIYVSGNTKHGTRGLFTLDLETGNITDTIFEDARVDFSGLRRHPISRQIAGVTYYKNGLIQTKYFNTELKAIQETLEGLIKGASISITSRAKNKPLYLIFASNSKTPGLYFLYNATTQKLTYLDSSKPGISSKQMASMRVVDIEARDGVILPSILTLPKGMQAGQMHPAVILPHGGPGSRDTTHWDEWAQFLANRGYVVLQPNFRGSTGFGHAFRDAGKNQWGGLMQDDLTDATKWLIAQGFADPNRICVMGASYGGYAALMGPIKEPGLYKCAISINGVINLPALKTADRMGSLGGKSWIKTMA